MSQKEKEVMKDDVLFMELCYRRYMDAHEHNKHLHIRTVAWSAIMMVFCLILVDLTNSILGHSFNNETVVFGIFLLLSWISLIGFYVFIMLTESVTTVIDLPSMQDWSQYYYGHDMECTDIIEKLTSQFAEGEDNMFNLYQKRMKYFKKAQIMAGVTMVLVLLTYIVSVFV